MGGTSAPTRPSGIRGRAAYISLLDTIESADAGAIQSLYWLAGDPSQYRAVTAHPTLVDGITDHDAKVVAVLHGVNRQNPLMRARFNLSLREAQRRGNLAEAEHMSTNRSRYGNEIANPRIEYGVAMTKWVRESPICLLTERSTVVVDWPVNRGTHAQPGGRPRSRYNSLAARATPTYNQRHWFRRLLSPDEPFLRHTNCRSVGPTRRSF